jgi:hypothetical protein
MKEGSRLDQRISSLPGQQDKNSSADKGPFPIQKLRGKHEFDGGAAAGGAAAGSVPSFF